MLPHAIFVVRDTIWGAVAFHNKNLKDAIDLGVKKKNRAKPGDKYPGLAPPYLREVVSDKKEGVREMKARGITRYGLVGIGFLLAGAMFLPGRAMAPPPLERGPIPEEELKEIKKASYPASSYRSEGNKDFCSRL